MIVEGLNCATELLRANYPVEKIIVSNSADVKHAEIKNLCKRNNVKLEIVDKKDLDKITKSGNHQGVISFVKPYEYYDLEALLKKPDPFLLILDGIVDPHNVGAIIRTAECMGVDGIIIGQNRACDINETVFKTSTGAVALVKVAKVVNLSQTIEKLKNKNIWCYALEAGEDVIYNTNLTGGIALVVGSEGKGVSRLVKQTCDGTISIPMAGKINSLNASNAAAIALYEVVRQKNKG